MAERRNLLLAPLLIPLLAAAPSDPLAAAVMEQLARLPSRSTSFVEEKRLASLTLPLVSHGRLVFVRPSHLEKDTEAPKPERLVIESDQLTITEDGAAPRTLALDEHPILRAIADTLRAAMQGDLMTLRQLYTIEAQGSLQQWRLMLVPKSAVLQRALVRVTLDGNGKDLRQIVIQQANDDTDRLIMQ